MFVLRYHHGIAFALRQRDGGDLGAQAAIGLGSGGFGLTAQRESILVGAGNGVDDGYLLCKYWSFCAWSSYR